MREQVFEFGSTPWRDGAGVLQIYMPLDLTTPATTRWPTWSNNGGTR